jgi:hypothetical protein
MKKVVLSVVAALAVTAAAPAFAADMPAKAPRVAPAPPPSPWDIAFGAAIMNDYIFRGVTQSGHKPSVAAYFEPRYNVSSNLQLYAGLSGESIKFANNAASEIDLYGGVRPTIGPFAFDFGFWYYYYPGGNCYAVTPGVDPACNGLTLPSFNAAKSVASFYEVYAKVVYTWTDWAFGANFYYSPNFLNTGAWGNYTSITGKYIAPPTIFGSSGVGMYVSGEFGRQWLGTSDSFYGTTFTNVGFAGPFPNGIKYADYNTWNIGIGFTYKVFTLDLRYYDTDLSKFNCNLLTGDQNALVTAGGTVSKWCNGTFVAAFKADLTLASAERTLASAVFTAWLR